MILAAGVSWYAGRGRVWRPTCNIKDNIVIVNIQPVQPRPTAVITRYTDTVTQTSHNTEQNNKIHRELSVNLLWEQKEALVWNCAWMLKTDLMTWWVNCESANHVFLLKIWLDWKLSLIMDEYDKYFEDDRIPSDGAEDADCCKLFSCCWVRH